MTHDDDYVLGTDRTELLRLGEQHDAWAERSAALWERAGLRAGAHVVDLGAGPGFAAFDLAARVGPSGRVVAIDRNQAFVAFLESECVRRGLTNVEAIRTSAESFALPANAFDLGYTRWLFSWLDDPAAVLARFARCIRPGGALALQEYIDWATLGVDPADALVDRVVSTCMDSWHDSGGTIDVGRALPDWAEAAGLVVEEDRPAPRRGRTGSPEWRWIDGFFASYVPRLVERGRLSADDAAAFDETWRRLAAADSHEVVTPTLTELILRKPVASALT